MAQVDKGKKRQLEMDEDPPRRASSSSLTPEPEDEDARMKRSKRAVMRTCPVCQEQVPVRLLDLHAELEMSRVEDILYGGAGSSTSPIDFDSLIGPNKRGAAKKAQKSMNMYGGSEPSSTDQVEKTLKLLQRRRKTRNIRLKEIITQDDDSHTGTYMKRSGTTCPICLAIVPGDEDVIEAHVNACIANASRLQHEAEERERQASELERARQAEASVDPWIEVEVDGAVRLHLANARGLRSSGVHVRDSTQVDIEDEVDVDGDDEFGVAQFTEQDVINPVTSVQPDTHINGDDDGDESGEDGNKTLRDLVAEGKVIARRTLTPDLNGVRAEVEEVIGVGDADRMNEAIAIARKDGDQSKLIAALEEKVKQLEAMRVSSSTSLLCRICLDPYTEPTVSTGCWHTCCRECWLRCLGSTKLCPYCKRITAATDLRRVYM